MTGARLDQRRDRGAVRIFVDPSGYEGRNIGDAAMLDVALERLQSRWSGARLTIHTLDRTAFPAHEPLDAWGSHAWSADAIVVGNGAPVAWLAARILNGGRLLRRQAPRLVRAAAAAALWCTGRDRRLVRRYLEAIRTADLLLVSGAGTLNDAFKQHALILLETIELAADAGVVTALMGQGIGPMADPFLRTRAGAILPRVDFLALRDGVDTLALVESLGIPAERIALTGDDAIAVAYAARPETLGSAIGVNLRAAAYAGVGSDLVDTIGAIVRQAAAAHGARLLAVPISRNPADDDLRTAARLMGTAFNPERDRAPSAPDEVLSSVRECRLVVAGSYHAAVLALSMGIPAVTIVASAYYAHKFRGLAGQFGAACRIEATSQPDFEARLRAAIDEAWRSAPDTRDDLLHAAVGQIRASEAAYDRVIDLVGRRIHGAHPDR